MKSLITITGDLGSGKSSCAQEIAFHLGFQYMSTGAIQRRIARNMGLTTLQLNERSMTNRVVDDRIDTYLKELGESAQDLVLDSRMSWYFVPNSLKVFMTVDPLVGAQRVLSASRADERHADVMDAASNNLRRKALEYERFRNLYSVDCGNFSNYDVVVDTTCIVQEAVVDTMVATFDSYRVGKIYPRSLFCPKRLVPTQSILSLSTSTTETVFNSMTTAGYDLSKPIEVLRLQEHVFVVNGHKRLSCALRLGLNYVPCSFVDELRTPHPDPSALEAEINATLRRPWIADWESAHGFRFSSYPARQGGLPFSLDLPHCQARS